MVDDQTLTIKILYLLTLKKYKALYEMSKWQRKKPKEKRRDKFLFTPLSWKKYGRGVFIFVKINYNKKYEN